MIALILAAWLQVAPAAEVPPTDPPILEDTGAPPPWGPGPREWVPPAELDALAAFDRYQRIARWGLPFYATGIAMGGYAVLSAILEDQPQASIALGVAGGAIAWGGAGAIAFGASTATARLYAGTPGARRIPGALAYGLLGISSVCYGVGLAGVVAAAIEVGVGGADPVSSKLAPFLLVGIPFGVAAGVPALVQFGLNGHYRHRLETGRARVQLVPVPDPAHPGLALAVVR